MNESVPHMPRVVVNMSRDALMHVPHDRSCDGVVIYRREARTCIYYSEALLGRSARTFPQRLSSARTGCSFFEEEEEEEDARSL